MSTVTSYPHTAGPETVDHQHHHHHHHDPSEMLGSWIVALTESRGVGREVGIVGLELEFGQVILSQLADSQTYAKTIHWLRQRPPSNILLVAPASPHALTILHTTVKHLFPETALSVLPRASFAAEKGYALLQDLCAPSPQSETTLAEVRQKYYALGAASAVIDWTQKRLIQTGKSRWERHTFNVKWLSVEGCMLIDRNTIMDLELINNAISSKSKKSLFGLLNHTYTPMANRLLRSNLLAPSTDIDLIERRLDAVQELIELEDSFFNLRKSLKILSQIDLDKLISGITATELANSRSSCGSESGSRSTSSLPSSSKRKKLSTQDPALAITKKLELLKSLRTILQSLHAIRSSLSACSSELLVLASAIFHEACLDELASVIELRVNQDSFLGIQKGSLAKQNVHAYAIKADAENQLLNVARETYKENLSDAMALCEALKAKYHLPRLTFHFETRAGFMLHIKKEDLRAGSGGTAGTDHDTGLPKVFTNIVKRGKSLHFTCLELKKKNQLIINSYQETCLLSEEVLDGIFEEFKKRVSTFFRLSEAIAFLDMLASFAHVATTREYVRPEFSDTLAISDGRHPIKELSDPESGEEFVPNDTYANDACSFQLVTGPNMSGKSIFLRQIALMVVMAQVGCFCPAKYASFPIFDALLTCLSKNDDIEAGLSTFSSEMKTLSGIMSSMAVCSNALIIIDELGRGTSPLEGVGIAHAFSEEIIKAKSFCFFATHFKELSLTLSVYPNVLCLHLETILSKQENAVGLTFPHKVHGGAVKNEGYGIELASIAALPPDVITRANEISKETGALRRQVEKRSKTNKVLRSRKVLLEVSTTLKNSSNHSKLPSYKLAKFLKDYQKDVIHRLQPDDEMASSRNA
ncbi:hypothetical protein PCANC_10804 [Puccinia coronata f. sp. avenae]|uniref:DNA mismatch repair protein MSH3 n=1 Tax=Puccinia coronata f. sp. avenae TaxID=200324 RepID=A0A2N5SD50_9BASI|nr:hypothetical protein PCASD_17672 [Puccinia coronata f. sp. avenae]PLW44865.1 hypothetical protein PCANC_10804 [Puccinia coronata f. sp. avenae]PLW51950.1 hypothetical protein PCASD_00880 [Puccinia coronata f. sp. avenae]